MSDKTYVVIPIMTATDSDATITILNATFQVKNESVKRYPHPDFGAWLIEQIYNTQKILAVTKTRGFFKTTKIFICPSCSTELNPDLQKPIETTLELKFHDFDPFTVKITIPSVECPKCNKACGIDAKGSLAFHVNEAILRAFKAENIKP